MDAGKTLKQSYSPLCTFQKPPVNVLTLRFDQRWIFVEQIGHKGKVEFRVSTDNVGWGNKLSTAKPVGLLQHSFCPLQIVFLLYSAQTTRLDQRHRTAVIMW